MPQITYAIGDVHGCASLLEPLLEAIAQDARGSGAAPRVLFLGDIVDRGQQSRQSMNLVCHVLAEWPGSKLILGNHDDYFLDFMTADQVDERRLHNWLRQGGYQTLESYGILSAKSILHAAEAFRATHPDHLQTLREASSIIIDRKYAYTHAGVDPSRPLTDQHPKDLRLIRDGFLDFDGSLSHVIVHGHTIVRDLPEIRTNRIGIDLGAYASGILCCLAASSDERELHFLLAEHVGTGEVEIRRADAGGRLVDVAVADDLPDILQLLGPE